MTEQEDRLSTEGERRRDTMLLEIQGEMTRMHHNRRLRRSGVGVALLAVAIGALCIAILDTPRAQSNRGMVVRTDPHGVDIAEISPRSNRFEAIRGDNIRMVEIGTDDVLAVFADVRVAAGIRCDTTGESCEIFFPGRDGADGLIIQ